jgi:hypothetical protein
MRALQSIFTVGGTIIFPVLAHLLTSPGAMDINLHSLPRRLIELRMEHADLDSLIDQASLRRPDDELTLRRLKKRRLLLRDQIVQIEAELDPPEPA